MNATPQDVIRLIKLTADEYGKNLSDAQYSLYVKILTKFTVDNLQKAIEAHQADPEKGQWMPMPANLIKHIDDGRPTASEAWINTPKSERESISWTEEARQAYLELESQNSDASDVDMKLAFRPLYDRLVAEARANGIPVKFVNTYGFDSEGREECKKLTNQRNYQCGQLAELPAPEKPLMIEPSKPVEGVAYKPTKKNGERILAELISDLDKKIAEEKGTLVKKIILDVVRDDSPIVESFKPTKINMTKQQKGINRMLDGIGETEILEIEIDGGLNQFFAKSGARLSPNLVENKFLYSEITNHMKGDIKPQITAPQ